MRFGVGGVIISDLFKRKGTLFLSVLSAKWRKKKPIVSLGAWLLFWFVLLRIFLGCKRHRHPGFFVGSCVQATERKLDEVQEQLKVSKVGSGSTGRCTWEVTEKKPGSNAIGLKKKSLKDRRFWSIFPFTNRFFGYPFKTGQGC